MNVPSVIVLVVLVAIVTHYVPQKYEGQTAEEWFNEYDEVEAQLEEEKTKIDEISLALEPEIELKKCIEAADEFHLKMFNDLCKKLETDKNLNSQQCTLYLVEIGAMEVMSERQKSSEQTCIGTYLEQ